MLQRTLIKFNLSSFFFHCANCYQQNVAKREQKFKWQHRSSRCLHRQTRVHSERHGHRSARLRAHCAPSVLRRGAEDQRVPQLDPAAHAPRQSSRSGVQSPLRCLHLGRAAEHAHRQARQRPVRHQRSQFRPRWHFFEKVNDNLETKFISSVQY